MLRIMPREMRMMSERILSLTDLPKGFITMICDTIMYSEAMGLGGFAMLEAQIDALKPSDPARLRLDAHGQTLDAGGLHAWTVVPSALDLLGFAVSQGKTARLTIINTLGANELSVAEGLGRRHGLAVLVEATTLTAEGLDAPDDPILTRVLQEGCSIAEDQWWRIWALAQTALSPDSVVSRRHAGPVIVADDGQIIGRKDNDDDTDFSLITSFHPEPTDTSRNGAEK
ncbi:hypothetical protein MLE19_21340 [Halomonas neptunia]|uniref:Uncharacterized protein n=1 Tax=Vreelandella neptunia TaxID=115551 RepID=A0ABS9SCN1_9GAMM|nr:hypothetical protein [Halomonas neptunia]